MQDPKHGRLEWMGGGRGLARNSLKHTAIEAAAPLKVLLNQRWKTGKPTETQCLQGTL